jgi:hypothetical protein
MIPLAHCGKVLKAQRVGDMSRRVAPLGKCVNTGAAPSNKQLDDVLAIGMARMRVSHARTGMKGGSQDQAGRGSSDLPNWMQSHDFDTLPGMQPVPDNRFPDEGESDWQKWQNVIDANDDSDVYEHFRLENHGSGGGDYGDTEEKDDTGNANRANDVIDARNEKVVTFFIKSCSDFKPMSKSDVLDRIGRVAQNLVGMNKRDATRYIKRMDTENVLTKTQTEKERQLKLQLSTDKCIPFRVKDERASVSEEHVAEIQAWLENLAREDLILPIASERGAYALEKKWITDTYRKDQFVHDTLRWVTHMRDHRKAMDNEWLRVYEKFIQWLSQSEESVHKEGRPLRKSKKPIKF